jgi:starch-binding outer membrane protein, SusD/RagB family
MKKIKYVILFSVLLAGSSCEELLNTTPTDFVSSTNYYNTADQLNKGLAGVYDILGSGTLYGEGLLSYMSYTNDEGIFVYYQPSILPPANFSYAPNNTSFISMWNILYKGINYANILIEALDAPNASGVSQPVKDKIKAQALFLRAYYYYMLVDRWGAVPMQLSAVKSAQDVKLAVTPIVDAYAQIIKDMTWAQTVLPKASVLGSNSCGRLSKNAAQGMLARVCLSMTGFPLNDESKYVDARAWCDSVMNNGENSLNPSYSDLFVKEARDEYYIKENMWEVEFYGNYLDTHREGGYVGIRNGMTAGASNNLIFPGYGYNFLGASIAMFKKYQSDPVTFLSKDLRRERNIAPYQWSGGNTDNPNMAKNYYPKNVTTNLYQRCPSKWRRDEETNLPRFKNANGTNFPILRYADVLLMFAEAENHINGPTTAAYNAINLVRERAYGTGYRVSAITLTSGGSGYPTQAPTAAIPINVNVSFDKNSEVNGASAAEAYTTVSGGKVTSIILVGMGAFYSSTPPVITITSSNGVGSGATATATMEAINPTDADLTPGLSSDQFFKEITDERARELTYETLRSHDLRRWGLLFSTIQDLSTTYGAAAPGGNIRDAYTTPALNIAQKHLFYPIPATEIATNAAIMQNPGW